MAQNPGVALSKEFETPSVRAKLDALLLLAMAVRHFVVDLSNATLIERKPRWYEILDVLAERIASQLPDLTEIAETRLIWNQFTSDLRIAALKPHAAGVIKRMEQELTKTLVGWSPISGLDYLIAANESAARSVARMEVQNLGRHKAETVPVRLSIQYDPKGEQAHASSVRGTREIRWAFQLEKYSLWAALVADRIFEHEYFCHLLPVNTHLAAEIREGFLDGVLQFEHLRRTTTTTPAAVAESRWNYALHRFRADLFDHFEATDDEDYVKLRNLGQSQFQLGPQYWPLVSSVMDCPDGADQAERLREKLIDF